MNGQLSLILTLSVYFWVWGKCVCMYAGSLCSYTKEVVYDMNEWKDKKNCERKFHYLEQVFFN